MLLALFGPWISQVFLLWRNQCSDRSIKACSPTEQGYGKVHRGTCCDKYKSGSSSQVSVAFYRTGRGRSRQPLWFDGACSSGSRCTVRSTGACRPECCSSPGEQAWWGLVMCSWPCNVPAVPTKKKNTMHKHINTVESDEKIPVSNAVIWWFAGLKMAGCVSQS